MISWFRIQASMTSASKSALATEHSVKEKSLLPDIQTDRDAYETAPPLTLSVRKGSLQNIHKFLKAESADGFNMSADLADSYGWKKFSVPISNVRKAWTIAADQTELSWKKYKACSDELLAQIKDELRDLPDI
jgi:hypothetical protein